MTDRPKTGKRVQVYIPADLVEKWDSTPRYERSATVALALRQWWGDQGSVKNPNVEPIDSHIDSNAPKKGQK